MWALVLRGYPYFACALLLLLVPLLCFLARSPSEGLELGWRGGRWYLLRDGERSEVEAARDPVLTPWFVQLVVRAGSRGPTTQVRIFVDSVSAHEWRLLRKRLRLQQGKPR